MPTPCSGQQQDLKSELGHSHSDTLVAFLRHSILGGKGQTEQAETLQQCFPPLVFSVFENSPMRMAVLPWVGDGHSIWCDYKPIKLRLDNKANSVGELGAREHVQIVFLNHQQQQQCGLIKEPCAFLRISPWRKCQCFRGWSILGQRKRDPPGHQRGICYTWTLPSLRHSGGHTCMAQSCL